MTFLYEGRENIQEKQPGKIRSCANKQVTVTSQAPAVGVGG